MRVCLPLLLLLSSLLLQFTNMFLPAPLEMIINANLYLNASYYLCYPILQMHLVWLFMRSSTEAKRIEFQYEAFTFTKKKLNK